jgi:hypothetical protein
MVRIMMLFFKEQPADSQGWRNRPDTTPQSGDDRQPTHVVLLWSMILALLTLLGSALTRQWLAHLLANICVLGGIVAAPLVSVVAWVGLLLPARALLHQMAPMLVAGSLIWFAMAIAGAHAFRLDRRDD